MDRMFHLLRNADAPGSSGGGTAPAQPATAPAAPQPAPSVTPQAGPAGAPPQPAQQPGTRDGEFVSRDDLDRFRRYEQQVRGMGQTMQQARDLGYESVDKALEDARQLRELRQNPMFDQVASAFRQPQTQPAAQPPHDPSDINSIVRQSVEGVLTARDQAAFERQYRSDQQIESRVLAEMATDPRLKSVLGEHSLDDALDGKAGPAAKSIAVLLDQALYDPNRTYENGKPRPITDGQIAKAAVDSVFDYVNALRAQDIVQSSPSGNALGSPGSMNGAQVVPQSPHAPQNGARESREDLRKRSIATFQQNVRAREAQGQGLPASQMVHV